MLRSTGTITATGTGNGVTHTTNPQGPDTQGVVGLSGTFTSAVVLVEGKIYGGSVYYPLLLQDRKTGVVSGTGSPSDSTATSYLFDARGVQTVRVSVSSGTPTSVAAEVMTGVAADFGGVTQGASVQVAVAGSTFTAATSHADTIKAKFGDGDDITMAWDGTDFDILQATANSSIKVGIDGAGIDVVLYGDTASAAATWDQSADSLILSGVAKIKHQTIVAAHAAAIPVTHSGSFPITQAGAETNTLADPTYLGQWLNIFVDTDTSGARVITAASRINQAANTIMTLTEVGDFIKLEAITIGGALKWQVVSNDGVALS